MKGRKTIRSPLTVAIDVLCARRAWTFADLVRSVNEAAGRTTAYTALLSRVGKRPPSRETVTLVALGFGMTPEELGRIMAEESARAEAGGHPIGQATMRDPAAAIVAAGGYKQEDQT